MFQKLLTIARNTLTESIRQPIFVVLILVGASALVLNLSLAAYSMEYEGDNKMLTDLGLSTLFVVGLLLAAFTATGVLSSEVENKTVLTVISKPVSRPLFVVGKYLGVAAAIALAFYVLSIVFVFTIRHRVMSTARDQFDLPVILLGLLGAVAALALASWGNYFYRWVFTSTFVVSLAVAESVALGLVLVIDKQWQIQSPLAEFLAHEGTLAQTVVGLGLIFEAVMLLTAVAVAASTRLGQVMTLLVCSGVFLVGLISNSFSRWVNAKIRIPQDLGVWESVSAIFASGEATHLKLTYAVAKIGYLFFPNLQFLWVTDAINEGNSISGAHVATVSTYSLLYVIVVISLAVALFQTREVG